MVEEPEKCPECDAEITESNKLWKRETGTPEGITFEIVGCCKCVDWETA